MKLILNYELLLSSEDSCRISFFFQYSRDELSTMCTIEADGAYRDVSTLGTQACEDMLLLHD